MSTTIIWTNIDEAPALATYSLLPIIQAFTQGAGVEFKTWDISLAGRVLANFPEKLTGNQQIPDYLSQLGDLVKTPEALVIKLPNISASIPQLQAVIKELQDGGFTIPDFPEDPQTDEERALRSRFAKLLGSAVNPVLREGNSDRRAAASVKRYGQKNPHRMMKPWPADSKCRVASMDAGDFQGSEWSTVFNEATDVRIEFAGDDGEVTVLKESTPLSAGEIIDTSVMNVKSLRKFFADQIEAAKTEGILLSLHLKATMMKVSDPVIFGHAVSVFYQEVLAKHADLFTELGVNVNNGIGDVHARIQDLSDDQRAEIEADLRAVYESRPQLAMVDSDKGITNLHAPNNVIIDASMPVVIRDGGRMWDPDGQPRDALALIPDRCYATMYQEVIENCQAHGAFDPAVMGSVSNVGLMAQKAEEYGSHDKTFEAPATGVIRVVDAAGTVLQEQPVEQDDVFRMCQTKDLPVRDWVKLAVSRARVTGDPAVFWLDEKREHHAALIEKVNTYLQDHDVEGLEIHVMSPVDAMSFSLERVRAGKDTISVTGNVLRDYLTDLFPIL
ncbi:MAG: NADP-dependent isocitrate dehydrogenase, partial [Planctomycetales bacterium]